MVRNKLGAMLVVGLFAGALALLPGCGSGGGGGDGKDTGATTGGDGPAPGGPPIPAGPAPGGPAPGGPAPGGPAPGGPAPGGPVPPAGPTPGPIPPVLPSFVDFDDVHALAAHPTGGVILAISSSEGHVRSLRAGEEHAPVIGQVGLREVRGMAFIADDVVMVVTDGANGGDDVLHRLDPVALTSTLVGPIAGHTDIEALVFHPVDNKLYAGAASSDELLTIDPLTGVATAVGPLGDVIGDIGGLASDGVNDVLYAVDSVTGAVASLDRTTGAATLKVILHDGPMRGFAYDTTQQKFFGVSESSGKMHELDPQGSWIKWTDVRGLADVPGKSQLYAAVPSQGIIARVFQPSDWKQIFVAIPDGGIEGLAIDPATEMLYGVSSTSGSLYRIAGDSGIVSMVGVVPGSGGAPYSGLRGLAHAKGKLYAVDTAASSILQLDPATAAAVPFTTLPSEPGMQSLTYDAAADQLLLYADTTQMLVSLDLSFGANVLDREAKAHSSIGGLARVPDISTVYGADTANDQLTILRTPPAAQPTLDAVLALAISGTATSAVAYDSASGALLDIDLVSGDPAEIANLGGAVLEGMAEDTINGGFYAFDSGTGSVLHIDQAGQVQAVGAPGALAGVQIRALAFDGRSAPGVLFGYNAGTGELVTIDLTDASVRAVGAPLGHATIEAMSFDPLAGTVLAIARGSQELLEITIAVPAPAPGAAPAAGGSAPEATVAVIDSIAFTQVQSMALIPGSDEIVVVDNERNEVARINRYTGETVEAFPAVAPHRGAQDESLVAALLWPRGEVRVGELRSFAVELFDTYEGDGFLSFERDGKVVSKSAYDPETVMNVAAIPETVLKGLKAGDELRWGIYTKAGKPIVQASVKLVVRASADAALKALRANKYVGKQSEAIRSLLDARVFYREGLFTEAIERFIVAGALQPDHKVAPIGLAAAFKKLLPRDLADWRSDDLIGWAGQDQKWSKAALKMLRAQK